MLQFVLGAGGHADQPLAAARLATIDRDGGALDVAAAGDGDEDVLVLDQVFDVELFIHAGQDLRPPRVAVLLLQLGQIFLDQLENLAVILQQALQVGDMGGDLGVLVLDLLPLQRSQPAQLHIEDGRGLNLGQAEARHQLAAGVVGVGRLANGLDDLIEVADGDEQAGQDMLAALGLVQFEARAPGDDIHPVIDVDLQRSLQREQARLLVHQRQ